MCTWWMGIFCYTGRGSDIATGLMGVCGERSRVPCGWGCWACLVCWGAIAWMKFAGGCIWGGGLMGGRGLGGVCGGVWVNVGWVGVRVCAMAGGGQCQWGSGVLGPWLMVGPWQLPGGGWGGGGWGEGVRGVRIASLCRLAQSRLPKRGTGALGYLFYAYWAASGGPNPRLFPTHWPTRSKLTNRAPVSDRGRKNWVRANAYCARAKVIWTFTMNSVGGQNW